MSWDVIVALSGTTRGSAALRKRDNLAMDEDFMAEIEAFIEEERRKEHPDYRNTVYCDRHLGVKMILATTWRSVEYGESSADANPTRLWYCPKEDCERCYEPTMFGYHWNSGKPGTRMRTNPERQVRCNHPQVPFMYIGKAGEGRRFICPLYKCGEQGPEVAASVVDEEVPVPADPLDEARGRERKRRLEMLVFQAFASASCLRIDEGSAENRDPDYPDILCTISGQRYWFELGRIINEDAAEKLSPNRRRQEGGFSYDQEEPLLKVISKKAEAAAKYVTEGAPVDLVLHFDLRLGSAATVKRLADTHAERLESLIVEGPFARVWVFDEQTRTVVWARA